MTVANVCRSGASFQGYPDLMGHCNSFEAYVTRMEFTHLSCSLSCPRINIRSFFAISLHSGCFSCAGRTSTGSVTNFPGAAGGVNGPTRRSSSSQVGSSSSFVAGSLGSTSSSSLSLPLQCSTENWNLEASCQLRLRVFRLVQPL